MSMQLFTLGLSYLVPLLFAASGILIVGRLTFDRLRLRPDFSRRRGGRGPLREKGRHARVRRTRVRAGGLADGRGPLRLLRSPPRVLGGARGRKAGARAHEPQALCRCRGCVPRELPTGRARDLPGQPERSPLARPVPVLHGPPRRGRTDGARRFSRRVPDPRLRPRANPRPPWRRKRGGRGVSDVPRGRALLLPRALPARTRPSAGGTRDRGSRRARVVLSPGHPAEPGATGLARAPARGAGNSAGERVLLCPGRLTYASRTSSRAPSRPRSRCSSQSAQRPRRSGSTRRIGGTSPSSSPPSRF